MPEPEYELVQSAIYSLRGVIDNTNNWFGTTPYQIYDNINISIAPNKIGFPAGTAGSFIIQVNIYGSSGLTIQPTFTLSNFNQIDIFELGANYLVTNSGDVSSTFTITFALQIANSSLPATLTATGGTYPVSPSNGDLIITQLNY